MERALRYGMTMLPAMAVAVLPLLLVRLWQLRHLRRKGGHTTALHEVGLLFFCCYLAGVASLTILPPWEVVGGLQLPQNLQSEISLVPLRVFWLSWQEHQRTGGWDYLLINLVGNFLIFLPVGFFPAFLWRRWNSWKAAAGWGLVCSLTIEICQLPLSRCTDIDDLWTNLLGALAGYGLYRVFKRLLPTCAARGRVRT